MKEKVICFKPHEQTDLVNRLRDVAITYKDCGSLRAAISREIAEFIKLHAVSGETENNGLVACPDCLGFGKSKINNAVVDCQVCKNKGKVTQTESNKYEINKTLA